MPGVDTCEARQDRTGQYVCSRCGYYWDTDDTAPPCKTDQDLKDEAIAAGVDRGRAALDKMRDIVDSIPDDEAYR